MSREEKEWHERFKQYMEFIANHPNYRGLPIKRKNDGTLSWFAPKQTQTGKARMKWCEDRAAELGFEVKAGVYAKVMREIHPTKMKVCQTCGETMSIYYLYPSANTLKAIKKDFKVDFSEIDHISDIWDSLLGGGNSESEVKTFFIKKGKLPLTVRNTKDEIIKRLEFECRECGKKVLSPGAMSNFPDRFDGFHTYNRCCRAEQDKGRHSDNMKTYNKDRRAYEYWSDGNIQAANKFMHSSFFDGVSADHIGPISLGFIHDPRYLRPMTTTDNSTKRDRLIKEDINELISVYNVTNIYPMTWFSSKIWDFIVENYEDNPDKIENYRIALKQNMVNFMDVLFAIKNTANGIEFLTSEFIEPQFESFAYDYGFNELGEIIYQSNRRITDSTRKEFDRFKRIAFQSVDEFQDKDNRNVKSTLDKDDEKGIRELCDAIKNGQHFSLCKNTLLVIMVNIQNKLINLL